MTVMLSPPTASATPSCLPTLSTVVAASVWKPWTITRSVLWVESSPFSLASNSNLGRSVPEPGAAAALVTVMSVPRPYSDSRTLSWALLMPEETELTMMTSAMPRPSPEATTSAAFLRRRSSRRR